MIIMLIIFCLGLVTSGLLAILSVLWLLSLTPYGRRKAEEQARRDFMKVMWWR